MRLLLLSVSALALISAAGSGQDAKKKDAKADEKEKAINEVAGKDLYDWIKDISSKDPSRREHAMRMILPFGAEKAVEAVPSLLKELKKHKPTAPIDLSVRINGASALGTILSNVKEPKEKEVKEAVAILKAYCSDPQVIVRTNAARSLGQLAPRCLEAQEALADVMKVAADRDTWQARQAGLEALSVLIRVRQEVESKGPPAVKEQLERIKKSPSVPHIDSAFKAFFNALEDNSMQVRITAVTSLANFHYADRSIEQQRVLRNLEKVATKDPEASLHIWAYVSMMSIKKTLDMEQVRAIAKLLDHPDPFVQVQAANTLGLIGVQTAPMPEGSKKPGPLVLTGRDREYVISRLVKKLEGDDIPVVTACIGAMFQIDADKTVAPVAALLNDSSPAGMRLNVAVALSQLGPKAKPAEGHLMARLYDREPLVAVACIGALVQMDSTTSLPALMKLSEDPKTVEVVKTAAADAVREIQKERTKNGKKADEKAAPEKAAPK
jgi:HEAT repeat protein